VTLSRSKNEEKSEKGGFILPRELAWREYVRLEGEFLRNCDYVSLADVHLNVYSYNLMILLVAIGVEFDSVSRALVLKWLPHDVIQDQALNKRLRDKHQKNEGFNMGDYRMAFESVFNASLRAVVVDKLNLTLKPFDPAPIPQQIEVLPWWKAFTNLKHDRIASFIEAATMKNVLSGLAALLIVNIYFRTAEGIVECPGQDLSPLFTVDFLKVFSRTQGVSKTGYRFIE